MKILNQPVKNIRKQVDFRNSLEYVAEVKRVIQQEFIKIKEEMLVEFDTHKVTQEIEEGVDATNISKTLGYGNLFTFIGFNSGDKPIPPIREMLNSARIGYIKISRDGTSDTSIYYPTADEIFLITPSPWAEGRSWAKGIESGMSGLGRYLQTEGGRSGGGLQVDNKVRGGGFRNTPYISSIIKNFEKKIVKLNKLVV